MLNNNVCSRYLLIYDITYSCVHKSGRKYLFYVVFRGTTFIAAVFGKKWTISHIRIGFGNLDRVWE